MVEALFTLIVTETGKMHEEGINTIFFGELDLMLQIHGQEQLLRMEVTPIPFL